MAINSASLLAKIGLQRGWLRVRPALWRLTAGLALIGLVACTSPAPRTPSVAAASAGQPTATVYSGRLSIQVPDRPEDDFSTSFELQGNKRQGQLALQTSLGLTLAEVQWTEGQVRWRHNATEQVFDDLPSLFRHLTGNDLPLDALFDWFEGRSTQTLSASGWQVLSETGSTNRLHAERNTPLPRLRLLLILDPNE